MTGGDGMAALVPPQIADAGEEGARAQALGRTGAFLFPTRSRSFFDPMDPPAAPIQLVLPPCGRVVVRLKRADGTPFLDAATVCICSERDQQRPVLQTAALDELRARADGGAASFPLVPLAGNLIVRAIPATLGLRRSETTAPGPRSTGADTTVELDLWEPRHARHRPRRRSVRQAGHECRRRRDDPVRRRGSTLADVPTARPRGPVQSSVRGRPGDHHGEGDPARREAEPRRSAVDVLGAQTRDPDESAARRHRVGIGGPRRRRAPGRRRPRARRGRRPGGRPDRHGSDRVDATAHVRMGPGADRVSDGVGGRRHFRAAREGQGQGGRADRETRGLGLRRPGAAEAGRDRSQDRADQGRRHRRVDQGPRRAGPGTGTR